MSVDYSAKCIFGYRVEEDDIPDYEERMGNEFGDCADEEDGYTVDILGTEYWCSDLVSEESEYYSGPVYIGPDMYDEMTYDELVHSLHTLAPVARRMYELVMRKPPEEKPRMYYFCHMY